MIYIGLVIIVINPPVEQPVVQKQPPVQAQPIETPRMEREPGMIYMDCEVCGWEGGYDNMTSAKQGMASHRAWCKKGHGRRTNLFG